MNQTAKKPAKKSAGAKAPGAKAPVKAGHPKKPGSGGYQKDREAVRPKDKHAPQEQNADGDNELGGGLKTAESAVMQMKPGYAKKKAPKGPRKGAATTSARDEQGGDTASIVGVGSKPGKDLNATKAPKGKKKKK